LKTLTRCDAERRRTKAPHRKSGEDSGDRRDCHCLCVVTNSTRQPILEEPIPDLARFPRHEVTKVLHYWLELNAMTRPMTVREDPPPHGGNSR
jgi:hypothetical protein